MADPNTTAWTGRPLEETCETVDLTGLHVRRVEREINQQLGGDATVRQIMDIMISLGWAPPTEVPRD